MADEKQVKPGLLERRREKKRLERERTGPSPEAASVKIGEQMLGGGGGG